MFSHSLTPGCFLHSPLQTHLLRESFSFSSPPLSFVISVLFSHVALRSDHVLQCLSPILLLSFILFHTGTRCTWVWHLAASSMILCSEYAFLTNTTCTFAAIYPPIQLASYLRTQTDVCYWMFFYNWPHKLRHNPLVGWGEGQDATH